MSKIWNNKYATLSEPKELFTVLIAAAGSGQRMGGVYKPFSEIDGAPMLSYSLDAFQKSGFVKQIVVTSPEEHKDEIYKLAEKMGCTKLKCVVKGGATRTESVILAFRAAFDRKEDITPFLAVHDAARPMITENIINDVFFASLKYGAAVAATRARDAIKKTGLDCFVTDEIKRDGVWQIQTPQAFDTDIFHTSLAVLGEDGASTAVDDGAVVMKAGFKVMCVESGFANFKVTYKEDLLMAEAVIRARKEGRL